MTGMKTPWLLTGLQFGMDEVSRVFLLFSTLIWIAAGAYALSSGRSAETTRWFFVFYCISLFANLGLIPAQDMVGFYLFFSVMTFASYILIVQGEAQRARYAGKVYITMALIGEILIVSAMMLIAPGAESLHFRHIRAAAAASAHRDLFVCLVLSGFGVKTGAPLLHMWMPLAYTAAPVPAAVVLSGAMVNAGLLGWIRFLPLGEVALPGWGTLCLAAGIAAAFYGVAVGVSQDNPKTVLAYSSISQMGLMTLAIGTGLAFPEAWPAALSSLLIYATHHALHKSSLFMGTVIVQGMSRNPFSYAGLLFSSLALAGAPFTSGAVAKVSLKAATGSPHNGGALWLEWLLPLTAFGTTLLMGRFLFLVRDSRKQGVARRPATGALASWIILLAGAAAAGFALPFDDPFDTVRLSRTLKNILSALWPVLGGILALGAVWRMMRGRAATLPVKIPPGDIIEPVVRGLRSLQACWKKYPVKIFEAGGRLLVLIVSGFRKGTFLSNTIVNAERNLTRWTVAGAVFLILAVLMFFLMSC